MKYPATESRRQKLLAGIPLLAVAIITVAVLAMACVPAASDAGPSAGIGFKAISGTEAEVHGINNAITTADVPSSVELNGKKYTVTKIAERGFSGFKSLKSVNLPETLTAFGGGAFENCVSLESMDVPEGVWLLDVWSFYECRGLKSVTIPKSVTEIGDMCFFGCTNPELKFTVDPDNQEYMSARYGQLMTKSTGMLLVGLNTEQAKIPKNTISLCEWSFQGCDKMITADVPNGVRFIGYDVFSNCIALRSVSIPKSVLVIGYDSFLGCTDPRLMFVVDADNPNFYSDGGSLYCKKTDELLFSHNSKEVSIRNGTKSIGTSAFNGFKDLKKIVIPKGVTHIGEFAFYNCSSLETVELPSTVREIGRSAFDGCVSLKTITVPDGVARIGTSAFEGCSSMTSAEFPDSLQALEGATFKGCASLKSFTIPKSVAFIGKSAFEGCSSLRTIVLSENVNSVEEKAYEGCTSVTSLTFLGNNPVLGEHAFAFGSQGKVSVYIKDTNDTFRGNVERHINREIEFRNDCRTVFECGNGGEMTADRTSPVEIGTAVSVVLTPGDGHAIKSLTVNGIEVQGKDGMYEVTVCGDSVIRAEFEGTGFAIDMVLVAIVLIAVIVVIAVAVLLRRRSKT